LHQVDAFTVAAKTKALAEKWLKWSMTNLVSHLFWNLQLHADSFVEIMLTNI
jgi:hypothetical protein